MAGHLPLLDATQRRAFGQPPPFNRPQRQFFFALPDWAIKFLYTLLAPYSRGIFVLQVGHFKTTGRFFLADGFLGTDCAYVQHHYHLSSVAWERYDRATRFHHRQYILQQLGVLSFEQAEAAVRQPVTHFARQQMNPVAVFHSGADYIRAHRWEMPTYATLVGLVTEAFRPIT